MKILLTGKNGQIGHELNRWLRRIDRISTEVVALDRHQMDLTDAAQVLATIRRVRPDVIVNAAAYTAVDLAERDSESAMRINADAVGEIADEARRCKAALVHFSTDHVFDGRKGTPYLETDATGPINAYGRSKLAGESAIRQSGVAHLIFRTSWVYGAHGKNFLKTIQQLLREKVELAVVSDQFGAPTWARTVAQQTAHVLTQLCDFSAASLNSSRLAITPEVWEEYGGLYHLTAQGHTTWHGLASAVADAESHTPAPIILKLTTDAYPALARRPRNARLSCDRFMQRFGLLPAWGESLADCLQEMRRSSIVRV